MKDNLPATTGIQNQNSLQILKTSPQKFYNSLAVRTFEDIAKSNNQSLAGIRKELGEMQLQALLTIILIDLIEYFNVGKTMGEQQVVQTVKLIIDEYHYLKPEDFRLCFDNAKKGKYGKVFDRIDGAVIFEWLNQHVNNRFEFFENKSIQEHEQIKYQEMKGTSVHRERKEKTEQDFHQVKVEQFKKQIQNNA